jgi:glutamyl/glutaminyl-tRNA synthetase
VSVLEYQDQGYLPEALLNYLVRLGWSHGDQEYFTRDDMIAAFDVRDINKAASALNPDKMLWLNQQHMVKAQPKDIVPHLRWHLARLGIYSQDDALLEGIVLAQRERAKTLKEMAENSRFFFGDEGHARREGGGEASDGGCEGIAQGAARAVRGDREWARPRARGARGTGEGEVAGPGQGGAAAARRGVRAAPCRRPSMRRWRCSARRARWRAWTAY